MVHDHAEAASTTDEAPPQIALRPPDQVMRLERMGSFFPTRLSFMRTLVRRLSDKGTQVRRVIWEIDAQGFGRAVYTLRLGAHTYSLVAFATQLSDDRRTDRVIAEAWDTSYVLFDGVPDREDLERLAANVPLQEAGRFSEKELVLSRANKSMRLFSHVVERLAHGQQPDADLILSIGYLMRTTAVYGNGKFGIADREVVAGRPGLDGPFQAEMLAVWLIRGFTLDLVEHIAREQSSGKFKPLAPRLKRYLGIGNATGLGMAPFLVSHPVLINNWMMVRETALARVCAVESATDGQINDVIALLARAQQHCRQWVTDDERQMTRIICLRDELAEIAGVISMDWLAKPLPWQRLIALSGDYSLECQELVVALVLEPNGGLIDGLADCMGSTHRPCVDPSMPLARLGELVDGQFDWALALDFSNPEASRQFWYVSEEKLEPRLGDRTLEPGIERALPLDIAVQAQALKSDIKVVLEDDAGTSVGRFLRDRPRHRYVVRRVQASEHHPYSEIRDNLIDGACLAIDMLRCKLSFFGAVGFDPKSDRWTRITMFQGAPLFDELGDPDADDWWLPVLEGV